MDASPSQVVTRNPVEALQAAMRDGIDRYKALKDAPESRKLLSAAAVSYIGNRFKTIALVSLSYKLGDGVLGVGGMLAIQMIPGVVLQPLAGTLVDRFPGKKLMIVSQFLMAAAALSFIALTVVPNIWLLYALTFMLGTIQTVDTPAMEVRLMSVTPREKRGTANAVQMLAITAGEIVGPAVGGVLLMVSGATLLFVLNAAAYVLLAAVVATLPDMVAGARASDADSETTSDAPALGYRTLLRRSDVTTYAVLVAASYMMFFGAISLYIVRAHDLGLGDGSVGLFYTVMGIGTFIGSIFGGMGTYMNRRALGLTGIALTAGALAVFLFGVVPSLLLAIPLLVLVGVIGDVEEIAALTYFQNQLPEGIYARFFSLFMMSAAVGGLAGSLIGPYLSENASTIVAFAALCLPAMGIGLVFALREGGVRLAIPPFVPEPEPEVEGHLLAVHQAVTATEGFLMTDPLIAEPRTRRLS